MYINSISAIKMGSQSKHLKPPNATGTLKNRASARNRTRADGRRETRIALVARARERERISDCPAALGPAEQLEASASTVPTETHPRRANETQRQSFSSD